MPVDQRRAPLLLRADGGGPLLFSLPGRRRIARLAGNQPQHLVGIGGIPAPPPALVANRIELPPESLDAQEDLPGTLHRKPELAGDRGISRTDAAVQIDDVLNFLHALGPVDHQSDFRIEISGSVIRALRLAFSSRPALSTVTWWVGHFLKVIVAGRSRHPG